MKRKLLLAIGMILVAGCLVLALVVINSGIFVSGQKSIAIASAIDVRAGEKVIQAELHNAPWQGLRYLPEKREWRFYAVAGETRQIDLVYPFDLVKVSYLQPDGDLAYTWAAKGLQIPGKGYVTLADNGIQTGDLLEISVSGEYVSQNGVNWEECPSEVCHAAQMIDTLLILDDQGTGISNGFIREGWAPPTYPMYGFLCWQLRIDGEDAKSVAEGGLR
jgi:hypothetical protein